MHDIKSVVLVQRPCNLDTACYLALLQEEADTTKRPELKKVDYSFKPKSSITATPLPLPPPSIVGKTSSGSVAIANPATRNAFDAQAASKVAALTAYKMAQELCRYCAKKWVKGHKCAATVPLHAVQEIWEMLSTDSESDQCTEDTGTEEHVFMLLSQEALAPGSSSKTLTFQGFIQGQVIVILINSGSSNSFLNTKLAPQLTGVSKVASPIKVQVANGQLIQCQSELHQACWEIQRVKFISDFKLLPLPYYDVILGVDWLQTYPMQIDWLNKWFGLSTDLAT